MFITFEGVEGSGKSTQLTRLAEWLRSGDRKVIATKEPGGTATGDRIRQILLDTKSVLDPVAEVFLFAASRRQHVTEVIRPALRRGEIVLCDRFTDSTLAYQGFGRLIDLDRLRALNRWATDDIHPDLTLLFDLTEEAGLTRARSRNSVAPVDEGRFEAEDVRFHRRVREGYLSMALTEPQRYAVVDASGPIDVVFERTRAIVQERMR